MNIKQGSSKDSKWWQPLIAAATVCIAGVGAWATNLYNDRQVYLQELEAVEKFFPHLVSEDSRLSAMARRTVKKVLRDKALAQELINDSVKLVSERDARPPGNLQVDQARLVELAELVGERIQANIKPVEKRPPVSKTPPVTATKVSTQEGWAYMGEYAGGYWRTRYFDFSDKDDPKLLKGAVYSVRERTGALNVRLGMPKPDGEFPQVIDVLKVGVEATFEDIKDWQGTGYMWAKITYQQ